MYKTILRTLSALSIVTITASAGFAAHEADDPVIDCADPANTYVDDCRTKAGIKPVTTDVWKDSFGSNSVPPPVEPDTTSRTDQFVLPADSLDHYTNKQRVNLKFDANNDGTDTIVGSSIFYMNKTGDKRNFYAGIRIGADLGEPIVEAFPEVVWKTRFKAVGTRVISKRDFYINEIFDLTVKFIGTSDDTQTMGKLSGYIQQSGYYGFKIDAQFNDDGVITTGTGGITYGRFENAGAAPTETVVGNLTGIIGDRGALGAFHSDGASSDQILGFAGGFRANGFSEDELTVLRKCVLDPFHGQCGEDKFDVLKYARVDLCTQGDKASVASRNTNPFECHNAVAAHSCILNPFQATCTGEGSDFNQYLDVARANRAEFCDSSNEIGNPLCTGGTIVADLCTHHDPFHLICGDDYEGARKIFIASCLRDGALCRDDIRSEVLKRPNALTWKNAFRIFPSGLDPDSWSTHSFLTDIEKAQAGEDAIIASRKSLNLSNASFSINGSRTLLGGESIDGVGILVGRPVNDVLRNRYYSGILSTTDLGAPITEKTGTASWIGSFALGTTSMYDFVLEINFDSQAISAFIKTASRTIKGKFDDNGVIIGRIAYSSKRSSFIGGSNDLSVNGLIGKEGAVGVFDGGGFVARPVELVRSGANSETIFNSTCTTDPFHEFCYFSNARKAIIDDCSTGRNAMTPRCASAVAKDPCIADPFDIACTSSVSAHHKIVLKNRSNFCNVPANADDNLCKWDALIALCLYEPFSPLCVNDNDGYYDNVRKLFCQSEPDSERCADYQTSDNVTSVSWISGFYKNKGFIPFTEPSHDAHAQFLQGTKNGVNTRGATGYSQIPSSVTTLSFADATFGGLKLDGIGDAIGGIAQFSGGWNQNNFDSYVAILSNTDLGAPFTDKQTPDAVWYGAFSGRRNLKTDFTLKIDFGAGTNPGSVGTIEAYVDEYHLKGDFDANGVIDGYADYDDRYTFLNGKLTGLIGQDGAVGAIIQIGSSRVRGGFVAVPKEKLLHPNVHYMDWISSFSTPPSVIFESTTDTQQSRFVQGTNGGSHTRILNNPVTETLTLAHVRTDGDGADSVAYTFGRTRLYTSTTQHYAGLLSGTNLGAALPTVPAGVNGAITAIWDGKLGLIANQVEIAPRDIKLTVDFTNKRISHKSEVGGAHLVDFSATWNSGVGYDGVFTGEITYDATPRRQTNGSYVASGGSVGIVTGLIGEQGAVGAFRSDGTVTTPYVGGFVAVPEVNYDNWVHGFGATGLPATPNISAPKNEFLQSGGTTLSEDDFTFPDHSSLNGTSIREERLSGEAADGVAFSRGTRGIGSNLTDYYYAEISSTTELGRPLSQTSGRAIARGHFKFVNTDAIQRTVGFDLKIIFDSNVTGNINAFISIRGRRSSDLFYLAGTFDVGGNIRGDIYNNSNLTETTTLAKIKKDTSLQAGHGTLRGLIGQDGAVGAFISTATDLDGYSGGFVTLSPQADISIDYLDWVSSFAEPLVAIPTLKNQFLKDGDTSLPSSGFGDEKPGHLNLGTATFGGVSLDADGDDTDGVSFFRGTRGGEKYFYAGITSTTNLGAPIIDGTKDGNWKGRLKIVFHDTGVKAVDFNLNVSFGSTISNAAGNIRATIAASDLPINNPFVLTGTFDTRGVIKGTASNLVSGTDNGLMTGLIGQDGAVGAFISNNPGDDGYAGGFVAVPPAEPASP